MNATRTLLVTASAAFLGGLFARSRRRARSFPGSPKRATTLLLELGARGIQRGRPTARLDVYLCGFHPMKHAPHEQMEAHHYCEQVTEDFMQCALYDGEGDGARLNGIEYIISERLYASLPEEEKQYWHPHNYEILSGTLVAPGLPPPAEDALMRTKLDSYGKTWHVWRSEDELPLGNPHLAWSFNRDGEIHPDLLRDRDRRHGIDTAARRRRRKDLAGKIRPQRGTELLKDAFPSAAGRPPADGSVGPPPDL